MLEYGSHTPFYAANPRVRRQVFRIRDIGQLLRRHHGHSTTTISSSPSTDTEENLPENQAIFDAIHDLTARDLLYNDTKFISRFISQSDAAPLHSLVGLKVAHVESEATILPTTESPQLRENFYRHSLSGPDVSAGYVYSRLPSRASTTTLPPQYLYPGGFVRPTEETTTTRRPFPHESPFYRVISSTNQQEFEQIREVPGGVMEG